MTIAPETAAEFTSDEQTAAALDWRPVSSGEQAEIDEAWRATINRRLDDLESGAVQWNSGRETIARARARIQAHREAAATR